MRYDEHWWRISRAIDFVDDEMNAIRTVARKKGRGSNNYSRTEQRALLRLAMRRKVLRDEKARCEGN